MKVLVANLGSTSFKYRLFDLSTETQLARGGIDRIGQSSSACFVEIGNQRSETQQHIPDHAAAVGICLQQLTDPQTGCLKSVSEVAGIGFKAVFAGSLSGVRIVNEELLQKMEALSDIAPAITLPMSERCVSCSRRFRRSHWWRPWRRGSMKRFRLNIELTRYRMSGTRSTRFDAGVSWSESSVYSGADCRTDGAIGTESH